MVAAAELVLSIPRRVWGVWLARACYGMAPSSSSLVCSMASHRHTSFPDMMRLPLLQMAPEHFSGVMVKASDIYSLGQWEGLLCVVVEWGGLVGFVWDVRDVAGWMGFCLRSAAWLAGMLGRGSGRVVPTADVGDQPPVAGVMIWEMAHSKKPFSGLSHSKCVHRPTDCRLA